MADLSSFSATPNKRFSAAFVDFLIVGVVTIMVHALGDLLGRRMDFEVVLAVVYFAYHAGFLYVWAGQSPGRRTFDISVISAAGSDLQPWQAVVRSFARPALVAAISIPIERTMRTDIALQTISVVIALEFALLIYLKSRRTAADLIAGTLVVNTPPPQPHRAPAVPMYSASDAEFGLTPLPPDDGRKPPPPITKWRALYKSAS